jgi:hypothetical protein
MKDKKGSLRPVSPKAKKGKKKDGPRGEGAAAGEPPPPPPKTIDPVRGGRR